MAVLCPRHHKELRIDQVRLTVFQTTYLAVTGTCPDCNSKYINRPLFTSGNTFHVDGMRYEFLQELSAAFPFDPEAEQKFQKQEAEQLRKEDERQRKKAQQKEQKRRQEELQRKHLESLKQKRDANVAYIRKELDRNPNLVFRPAFTSYVAKLPSICPYDSEPLLMLNSVNKKGSPGLCCIRCARHFILKFPKKEPQQKTLASKTTPTAKKTAKPTKTVTQAVKAHPNILLHCPDIIDPVPDSTILIARLIAVGFGKIGCIAIVADEREQDSRKGLYWVGRTLPSMILAAIQTNKRHRFQYKDVQYRVDYFSPFKDTQKYFDIIARFCNPTSPQTVYVFTQKNISYFEHKNYEMVTAMIPCSDATYPVPITVYYDNNAHQYFINEATYSIMRQRYGLPYLRLRSAHEVTHTQGFSGLKQHSELYLLGYSVNASAGMTMQSRRRLLSEIIDSGVLSKHEVINHLEWLINTRRNIENMDNAVSEWKSDLLFISNYQINKQRAIWVEAFKSKYSAAKGIHL